MAVVLDNSYKKIMKKEINRMYNSKEEYKFNIIGLSLSKYPLTHLIEEDDISNVVIILLTISLPPIYQQYMDFQQWHHFYLYTYHNNK